MGSEILLLALLAVGAYLGYQILRRLVRAARPPIRGVSVPPATTGRQPERQRPTGAQGAASRPASEIVQPYVFVSYDRDDQHYVERLVAYLKSFEVNCWIDKSGIEYGSRWGKEIQTNLDRCAAFVVVMTPASEESEWVEREVLRARKLGKPILPLLLEGEEFFSLGNIQHESVVGKSMPSEEWVERLRFVLAEA